MRSIRRISCWNVGCDVTRLDRTADDLVEAPLQLAQAVGDVRQLLHPLAGALGHGADGFHAAIDRGGDVLQRGLAVLDEVAQERERESPFFFRSSSRMICANVTAVRSSPDSFSRIFTSSPAFTQRAISSSVT